MKIYLSFLGCTPNFISLLSEWILFILILGSWAVVDLKESNSRFNLPVYDKIIFKLGFWSAFRNIKLKKNHWLVRYSYWPSGPIHVFFLLHLLKVVFESMFEHYNDSKCTLFRGSPIQLWRSENSFLCRTKSCF